MLEDLVVGVKLKDEKETLAADDIVRVDEYTIDMTITSGKYPVLYVDNYTQPAIASKRCSALRSAL